MEFMLLGLIAIFLVVVAPIWALVGMSNLKRRVDELERQLRFLGEARSRDLAGPDDPATDDGASDSAPPAPVHDSSPTPTDQMQPAARATADGPWARPAAASAPPPPPPEDGPPGRFVLTAERLGQLTAWLRDNWIVAVAAVSLGLTGVFFVQYGIENGLLSPRLRVLSALGLGLALIAGGEAIRRRLGDDHDLAAFVPSAFSGAGLVAIFAGLISARQLYDLIGPTTAFSGMVATALAAIVLGWFYGPFLIAFGIVGATAAPFLVGGSSPDPWILMYYFALIAGAGLAVDALRRSAWISTLALALPAGAAWLVWTGTAIGAQHLIALAALLFVMATALPPLTLRPGHGGASTTGAVLDLGTGGWPEFPTRIAFGGALIAIAFAVQAAFVGATEFWLSIALLTGLIVATATWLRHAPALGDIALFAAIAVLGLVASSGLLGAPATMNWITATVEPEAPPPLTMTWLTGLGIGLSALAYATWTGGRHWLWGIGAALMAPAMVIIADLWWAPLTHLTRPAWALHGIAVAAAMTLGAVRTRRLQPEASLAIALFATMALTMIGFAAVVLLTKTALTLAFAVLALTAAWLDRRNDLAPLTLFVQVAALACSFRLAIDPGLFWALEASWPDFLGAYAGTVVLLAAAWVQLGRRDRSRMVVESVAATLAGIGMSLALIRLLDDGSKLDNHWAPSLLAMIWLLSGLGQLYRARAGFRRLRLALASVFAGTGLVVLGLGLVFLNPLGGIGKPVIGPPLLDSLAVAYLLPAGLFIATWRYFPELGRWLRRATIALAAAMAAFWAGLEIRRLWRGPDLNQLGVTDPEMYSYTIALIALSAGLLGAALLRRSATLRKLGLAAAGIAVAKVFLLDASGLTGLTRVFSFLALGLALAGLAMVNRWIIRLQGDVDTDTDTAPPPELPE